MGGGGLHFCIRVGCAEAGTAHLVRHVSDETTIEYRNCHVYGEILHNNRDDKEGALLDNAQALFESLTQGGYEAIKRMYEEGQEENLFLDFKEKHDASHGRPHDEDKKNFSKALSGFSNATGGVVVWGVKAKAVNGRPDVACELKPIRDLKLFLTSLNRLISDALVPPNRGIQNHMVELPDSKDVGFIVTYVPMSDVPPHEAKLGVNRYCIRIGESFLPMEHFMLEDIFGRRRKPKLSVYHRLQDGGTMGSADGNAVLKQLVVGIQNSGLAVAKYPAMRLKSSTLRISEYGLDGNRNWTLKPSVQTWHSTVHTGRMFTGGVNDVVHPTSFIEVVVLEHPSRYINTRELEVLPKDFFRFSYEIYAEDTEPVTGDVVVPWGGSGA